MHDDLFGTVQIHAKCMGGISRDGTDYQDFVRLQHYSTSPHPLWYCDEKHAYAKALNEVARNITLAAFYGEPQVRAPFYAIKIVDGDRRNAENILPLLYRAMDLDYADGKHIAYPKGDCDCNPFIVHTDTKRCSLCFKIRPECKYGIKVTSTVKGQENLTGLLEAIDDAVIKFDARAKSEWFEV